MKIKYKKMKIFILLLFPLLLYINNSPIKPVIAIYGNSEPENDDEKYLNGTYYPISYIYWLESAGAQVMALHYWYSYEEIDEILKKINGIFFLGGGRILIKEGTWELKAKFIIEQSIKYDLPIWGTCQGFQLLGVTLSNNFTLLKHEFNDKNVLHNLDININTKTSEMFKLFTPSDFDLLTHTNSTIYNHEWGFYPKDYYTNEKLEKMTLVTSTSKENDGKEFINSFEGRKNKFYAVQFHPEKNPYRRKGYNLENNIESLKVSQKLLFNFIQQTRKNNNRFNSKLNHEGDRAKYDFFDTYNGTKNSLYDKDSETFYFYKKEE